VTHYLKYGKEIIRIDIRNGKLLGVLKTKKYIQKETGRQIIANALKDKVEKFILKNERVGVVIHDNTRVSGLDIYLPMILERLRAIGTASKDIVIFVASGSHRGIRIEDLGLGINGYKIVVNNAFRKSCFYYTGRTRRGTPVWINKELGKVDKLIATSGVLYHYFAGYGGGPKILMPGLAALESIAANHRLTLTQNGEFNPKCRTGNIRDNPVYLDIIDSLKFFPPTLYLGTVLNNRGKVVQAFCGDIVEEHRKAAKFLDRIGKVKIKSKAGAVICSAGGYPKDIDLIQSHKSIHNSFSAVRAGGTLICLAECPEGIGSKTFLKFFDYKNIGDLKKNVFRNYSLNGQTSLAFWEKLLRVNVVLVTGLKSREVNPMVKKGLTVLPPSKLASFLSELALTDYYVIPSGNSLLVSS